MALHSEYLNNMVGKVIELHLPYKAVLAFQYKGKTERALLGADKIIVDGKNVATGESIDQYLQEGSMVKFSCHTFNQSGKDGCSFFVTMAWKHDLTEMFPSGPGTKAQVFLGIYNASGIVTDVSQRQGVITYVDSTDQEQSILFLASKLFLFGKRVSSKQILQNALALEDKVQFDAVPCEKTENHSWCPWFATLVWKGKKPNIEYDNPSTSGVRLALLTEPRNLAAEIRQLVSNPKSIFLRGYGRVIEIINEEYGIALATKQHNVWESVLFHRSACFLFKINLGSHDLTKIFKEGDRVCFIAARAPKQLIAMWVASQVNVHVHKEVDLGVTT